MTAGKPKLCANCGKLIGVADVCPYCGADNSRVRMRLKRAAGQVGGVGALSVTGALVVVNVFFFATALLIGGTGPGAGIEIITLDPGVLFQLGLQYNPAIDAGQWWRVVTPIFLHLGVIHVVMNTYILVVSGRLLEGDLGGRLTFLIYMSAGILGFVASYFAEIGGAGASGAVSGLLAALLVRRRLVDGDFRHPVTRWVISLVVITAVFGLLAGGQINNVAHGVGFATGGLLAWLLTSVRLGKRGALLLLLANGGVAVVTFAAIAAMVLSLFAGSPDDLETAGGCWNDVRAAVSSGRYGAAETACLGQMPDLESEANAARDEARRALVDAGQARDQAAAKEAVQRLVAAFGRWEAWVQDAAPRYGARYGPVGR